MGKLFIVLGSLILGYGVYVEMTPKKKAVVVEETPEQKANKEKIAEDLRLKELGDANEAKGLNRDGSSKVLP
jgi:hypothetical protein